MGCAIVKKSLVSWADVGLQFTLSHVVLCSVLYSRFANLHSNLACLARGSPAAPLRPPLWRSTSLLGI